MCNFLVINLLHFFSPLLAIVEIEADSRRKYGLVSMILVYYIYLNLEAIWSFFLLLSVSNGS